MTLEITKLQTSRGWKWLSTEFIQILTQWALQKNHQWLLGHCAHKHALILASKAETFILRAVFFFFFCYVTFVCFASRGDVVICLSTTVRNDTLQEIKDQRVSMKCRKQLKVEELEMVRREKLDLMFVWKIIGKKDMSARYRSKHDYRRNT